jgi:hypothetical protein
LLRPPGLWGVSAININDHAQNKKYYSFVEFVRFDVDQSNVLKVNPYVEILGKKTFLMLNYNNDWRWGSDKEYCKWYKNIKIYRQDLPNSWDLPFQKCYEDILKILPKYEKN